MDAATFRELYERTAPALLAYLRYACGNSDLAKDLLQETFIRVLRYAPSGLGDRQMTAYLYKTAKSTLHDHWRKHRREVPAYGEHAANDTSTVAPDTDLPHDMLRVLGRLGERARTLLWLAYVEGFDHREIAELLGVRETSVRVMLSRARKQLATQLADEGLTPEESR